MVVSDPTGSETCDLPSRLQAVKHKREAWQMWSNYALAAAHAGAPLQALRGAAQVTFSSTIGSRV